MDLGRLSKLDTMFCFGCASTAVKVGTQGGDERVSSNEGGRDGLGRVGAGPGGAGFKSWMPFVSLLVKQRRVRGRREEQMNACPPIRVGGAGRGGSKRGGAGRV